jgi:hypothetical protein
LNRSTIRLIRSKNLTQNDFPSLRLPKSDRLLAQSNQPITPSKTGEPVVFGAQPTDLNLSAPCDANKFDRLFLLFSQYVGGKLIGIDKSI